MAKRLFALLFLATSFVWAGTYTSRLSLYLPSDGEQSWGPPIRNNFTIIDSSMCFISGFNNFTASATFSAGMGIGFSQNLNFVNSNGTGASTISNVLGLGDKSLTITAPDGLSVNNSPIQTNIGLQIYGGTGQSYGSFAVFGSSANGFPAYSGFIATSPISQSTLWSLPTADGVSGQSLQTDGAGHLSFSSASPILGTSNIFTGANNTFNNVIISSASSLQFTTSGGTTFDVLRNQSGLGSKTVSFLPPDGIGIGENNAFAGSNSPTLPYLTIGPGSAGWGSYGSFAVYGSSANSTATFSGFTSTANIAHSMLWALPPSDNTGLWESDGSSHLSISNSISSITVVSTGTVPTLNITANGTYGTSDATSGGLLLNCTGGGGTSGFCSQIYSNAGTQSALDSLLYLSEANSAWQEPLLYMKDAYTGAQSTLRIDSGWPTITFEDTTQPIGSAKKFQTSVHNGTIRFEGRNTLDNAFDSAIVISSMASYGDIAIGQGYNPSTNAQLQVLSSTANIYSLTVSTLATSFQMAVSTNGHIVTNGPTPTLSSCGGGTPSVAGNDNEGIITLGTGSPTACTLTFANSWINTPVCVVDENTVSVSHYISALSPTAFTVTLSATATTVYYRCGCAGSGCK